MSNPVPIFFGITRSFWFGIMPALLALLDLVIAASDAGSVGPIAGLIAQATGWDAGSAETVLRGAGSLGALIVAQQRAGAARPYTVRANAETLK